MSKCRKKNEKKALLFTLAFAVIIAGALAVTVFTDLNPLEQLVGPAENTPNTDPEPLPVGHPLWNQPRAVITPHISGGLHLRDLYEKLVVRCIRNVAAFTQHRPLESLVDRKTGYTYTKE